MKSKYFNMAYKVFEPQEAISCKITVTLKSRISHEKYIKYATPNSQNISRDIFHF